MASDPNVRVRISTKNEVKSGLSEAEADVKSFTQSVKNVFTGAFVQAALVIGAAGEALKSLMSTQADYAVQLEKTSQMTGISVSRLAELTDAAKLTNVPTDNLNVAFKRLAVSMSDANSKGGQAIKAMGLDVKSFHGDTNAAFTAIATKIAGYQDGAEKSAIITAIFGRSGAELIPLLNHLADATQHVKDLGATMTSAQEESLLKYDASMKDLEVSAGGLSRNIASGLSPALSVLVDSLTGTTQGLNSTSILAQVISGAVSGLVVLFFSLQNAINLVSDVGVGAAMVIGHAFQGTGQAIWDALHGRFTEAAQDMKTANTNIQNDLHTTWQVLKKDSEDYQQSVLRAVGLSEKAAGQIHAQHTTKAPGLSDSKDAQEAAKKEEELTKAKYDYELKAADGNYEKIKSLDSTYLAYVVKMYGTQSVEYFNMLGTIQDHTKAHNDKLAADKKRQDEQFAKELDAETDKEIAALEAKYNAEITLANGNYNKIKAIDAKHLADVKIQYGLQSAEYIKMTKIIEQHANEAKTKQLELAKEVANGIEQVTSAAFAKGGGIEAASKAAEQLVLGALGNILVKQGEVYLSQGAIMTSLSTLLADPFTAGPAGVGIGLALIALGKGLGSIASGGSGGGASSGGANHGVSQSGLNNTANAMGKSAGNATINVQGGFLNMNDPAQQKAFATAMTQISGRNVTVKTS